MNIPRQPFEFIGELTGYQKGYPSLCLRRPARAPLPSSWLRSFAVEFEDSTASAKHSVDLEPKGVVVVFEVVKFRASKSSLGVGPKAPIPFRSQSLCYAGQACMDGSEKQPLGPPCRRRRSSLPQSSPATSCTCVARGVLKNWILMESTSGRRIRIQRHAFVHLACLVSSVAVLG